MITNTRVIMLLYSISHLLICLYFIMYIVLPSHLFYRILFPTLSTLLPLMFVSSCICHLINKECMMMMMMMMMHYTADRVDAGSVVSNIAVCYLLSVECYERCSDEAVHYKCDETLNFCGFRCATTSPITVFINFVFYINIEYWCLLSVVSLIRYLTSIVPKNSVSV